MAGQDDLQGGLPFQIPPDEIGIEYVLASGPGGQNVNKTATAARLRFNILTSPYLPEDVRQRLVRLAGRRVTSAGELLIEARRFRTQEANRADALKRLADLLRRAAEKPKTRKATKPTGAAREKRLKEKKKHSEVKKNRRASEEF